MHRLAAALAVLLLALPARAQEPVEADALAIYRNDLALVTDSRRIDLPAGEHPLSLDGISPGIVPDSLDLAGDGLRLLELRLAPWPLGEQALRTAYLGEQVTLVQPAPDGEGVVARTARILSVEGGLVVETDRGIAVDPPGRLVFPGLPEGLSTTPRADVRVAVESGGASDATLRYLSRGLSWRAGYVARWDGAAGTLDITGLASLENGLSRPLRAEAVTLVAGEVSLSPQDQAPPPQPRAEMRAMTAAAQAPMPEPESRADLRLYPLSGAVTLPPGTTVRRPLLQASGVAAEQRYRIEGLATAWPRRGDEEETAARFRLVVPDTRKAGLGRALPAGTVRVYADGVFRGAQAIDDIPLGNELALDLGAAFDVTATARQTDFERLTDEVYEIAQTITVRNAKDSAASVRVVGRFPPEWDMVSESHPHERESATQPVWTLAVPAAGETELTYRVRVRR